jgi:hypothetical protein
MVNAHNYFVLLQGFVCGDEDFERKESPISSGCPKAMRHKRSLCQQKPLGIFAV